ncbi:MAG: hypothetical protein P0S94_04510 [Simkaniaceae bacterium]|nr:hypothetical protein [Simkaniaceae bacterium]
MSATVYSVNLRLPYNLISENPENPFPEKHSPDDNTTLIPDVFSVIQELKLEHAVNMAASLLINRSVTIIDLSNDKTSFRWSVTLLDRSGNMFKRLYVLPLDSSEINFPVLFEEKCLLERLKYEKAVNGIKTVYTHKPEYVTVYLLQNKP